MQKQIEATWIKVFLVLVMSLGLAACGGSSGGGTTTPPPPPANVAPVVSAGVNQTVEIDDVVNLSGTATDSDGTVQNTAWTQTSGSPIVTLTGDDQLATSFTAPAVSTATDLVFTLTATDDDGASSSSSVSISIEPPNAAPTVSAGVDQTIDEFTNVTLTAVANDSDGSVDSYLWQQLSGVNVTLNGLNSETAMFEAPQTDVETTLEFQVTVTDNEGETASDTVSVIVQPVPNMAPMVNAGDDQTFDEEETVVLNGNTSDIDGMVTSVLWTQISGPTVTLMSADTEVLSFVAPTTVDGEVLVFQLTATDNEGASASDTVRVDILIINAEPIVDAGDAQTVNEMTTVNLMAVATDSDGTIDTYSWLQDGGPSVTLSSTNTATTSFEAPDVDVSTDLVFEVTVSDNEGALALDTVTITVNPVVMATSAKVSGIIKTDTTPLVDIVVSSGGVVTTTNAAGAYVLNDVPVTDGMLQVAAEGDGFAPQFKTLETSVQTDYLANMNLLRYDVIETLDPTLLQTSTVTNPSGDMELEFSLPANSFTATAGETYSVNLAYGDPTTDNGKAVFPGDYLGADDATGTNTDPLESIAFSEITIKDSQGNSITEFNQPATVTSRLPDVYQTGGARSGEYVVGSTIAWWSYDEDAMLWVREDADHSTAGIQDSLITDMSGVLYAQAEVMHLTWWNVDKPITLHACLNVVITNSDGNPVPFVQIAASGVTYNGDSRPSYTDGNGEVSITVMRSQNAVSDRVALTARSQGADYDVAVINAADGIVGTNEFYTPDFQGSTIDNNGECRTINLVVNIPVTRVFGNVVDEFTAEVSDGVEVFTSLGVSATTDAEGNYEIYGLPVNQAFNIFVDASNQQRVTIPPLENELEVNFIKLNEAPVITSLSVDPAGLIDNSGTASLGVNFFDPELDAVSVAWSTDTGSLSNSNTATVEWTAPATGNGVALVNIVITDARGLTDSATFRIDYGEPGAFTVNVSVFDNGTSTPALGAYVILHDSSTGEPVTVFQADANGDVLIENAPVRSTVTVAHEFTTGLGDNQRTVRELITGFDVSQQSYDIVFNGDELSCENDNIAVTFENYPESLVVGDNELGFLSGSLVGGQSTIDTVNRSISFNTAVRCPSFGVQADDKISMLASLSTFGLDAIEVLAYGFLLDQDETATEYVGQLDKLPTEINFTSTNGVHDFSITPVRKNIFFQSAVGFSTGDRLESRPANFGSLNAIIDFPADYFLLFGEQETDGVVNFIRSDILTVPTSIDIDTPNYTLQDIAYDFPTRELSWSSNAGNEIDVSIFSFEDWTFYVPGERSTAIVPILPNAIQDWAATDTEEFFNYIDLELLDIGECVGYDDCLNFILDSTQIGLGITRLNQPVKGVEFSNFLQVNNPPIDVVD